LRRIIVTREEKETAVSSLQEQLNRATMTLVATTQGLNVAKMQKFRREIKQAGGEYKVAKNTLTRLALKETAFGRLEEVMVGPTGVVFAYGDPVAVTKVLVKFAEDNEKIAVRAGVLDNKLLQEAEIKELAKLPSREVLLAMLLGLLQAPATQLLRTIKEPGTRLVRLLDAVRARSEKSE
jgi:large subunit ribosomal protein L10